MHKTAASAMQLAKGILLHIYSRSAVVPRYVSTNKNIKNFIYQAGVIVFLIIN